MDKYEEYFIKYHELGLDLTRKQIKGVWFSKIVFSLFTILGIYIFATDIQKGATLLQLSGSAFMVLLFAAFLVYSFIIKTDSVFIQGGSTVLELNSANPDRQTVDQFIESLHKAIKTHYKNRYASIDPTLNEEMQIYTYKWLWEIDAITSDEYSELVQNLKIRNLLN